MNDLFILFTNDYTSLTDEITYQLKQLTDLVTKISAFQSGVLGNRSHKPYKARRSLLSKYHVVTQYMHKCNSILPVRKVWPSLCLFSQKLEMFNTIAFKYLILNLSPIGQQI